MAMCMEQVDIIIKDAAENDLAQIERGIELLNLDGLDLKWEDFVVAKMGEQIIGFGRLKKIENYLELSSLGILDTCRNIGISAFLINKLAERAKEKAIYLVTIIPEFFKKHDFEITSGYPESLKTKIKYCSDSLCGCGEGEKYVVMKKNQRNAF